MGFEMASFADDEDGERVGDGCAAAASALCAGLALGGGGLVGGDEEDLVGFGVEG